MTAQETWMEGLTLAGPYALSAPDVWREGLAAVYVYEASPQADGEHHGITTIFGQTPEQAMTRARQFAAAALALDACKTYQMAMEQEDGPTDDQWEFIGEKVWAALDAAKGDA